MVKTLTLTFGGETEDNWISVKVISEINKVKKAEIEIANKDGDMRDSYDYPDEVIVDIDGSILFTGRIYDKITKLSSNSRPLSYNCYNYLASYSEKYTTQDYTAGESANAIITALFNDAPTKFLVDGINACTTNLKMDLQDEAKTLLQAMIAVTKAVNYEFFVQSSTKTFVWRTPKTLDRENCSKTFEYGVNISSDTYKRSKIKVKNAIKVKGTGVDSGWRPDEPSIALYGRRELVVSESTLTDVASCQQLADTLLTAYKDEQEVISFDPAIADETLDVGDIVEIIDSNGGLNADTFLRIQKIISSYDSGGFKQTIYVSNIPVNLTKYLQS